MRKRIVYTRPDGGVTICTPSTNCTRWMSAGGRWADQPRGHLDIQIERNVRAGHYEGAAARFCRALAFGGLTEKEALETIRDRDCAHRGTGIECWDVGDIPSDRWFRDAWRRSHNGGPIDVHMGAARRVQLSYIKAAAVRHNSRRAALGRRIAEVQWGKIGGLIRSARDTQELRRIWPDNIPVMQ